MAKITRWLSDLWFDFFSGPDPDEIATDQRWHNALLIVENLVKERDNLKEQVDVLKQAVEKGDILIKLLEQEIRNHKETNRKVTKHIVTVLENHLLLDIPLNFMPPYPTSTKGMPPRAT